VRAPSDCELSVSFDDPMRRAPVVRCTCIVEEVQKNGRLGKGCSSKPSIEDFSESDLSSEPDLFRRGSPRNTPNTRKNRVV
jgi:hypothetical protein